MISGCGFPRVGGRGRGPVVGVEEERDEAETADIAARVVGVVTVIAGGGGIEDVLVVLDGLDDRQIALAFCGLAGFCWGTICSHGAVTGVDPHQLLRQMGQYIAGVTP